MSASVESHPLSNGVVADYHHSQDEAGKKSETLRPLKRSQFGDMDDGIMTLGKWEQRWGKGQAPFHMQDVNPSLKKHYELLTEGKDNQRIFLPLCGKSVDLRWLAEKGHDVIGNEGVELACKQFYEENNIEYTTEPILARDVEGLIFKSKDPSRKVTLYCCDYFKLTKDVTGQFDCIWDRASLPAVNREDRKQYAETMTRLLSRNTGYLVNVFRLDNTHFSGPPHNFTPDEMTDYFGDLCKVELLCEVDGMTEWQRDWGIDSFLSCDYFITLK